MSEAAAAAPEPKKGGSKLPIILILGVMLGAGGYFGMKSRAPEVKPRKPEVKLGKEKAAELKEFLVNLAGGNTFCKAEISLGMVEGCDPKLIEEHTATVRDAINLCLKSKTAAQVSTPEGLMRLKRELATEINDALYDFLPDKDKPDEHEHKKHLDAKQARLEKAAKDLKDPKDAKPAEEEKPDHPEFDSDSGPVLKVYFDSFVTENG